MNQDEAIIEALDQIPALRRGSEMPGEEGLQAIRSLVARSLQPVRPWPTNRTLVLLAVSVFMAFSVVATIPVHFLGFHRLLPGQKLVYYSAILLAAASLSATLIQEIIPGSKRRISPGLAMLLPVVWTAVVSLALFPALDFTRFTKRGLPCLELGTVCAGLSGLLAYLSLRNGLSSSPVRAAATGGLLAGLAGFAVLALHCPVLNIAHIAVWHLGPLCIAASAGALIAVTQTRFR